MIFTEKSNFRKSILENKLKVWMVRLAPILVYRGSHKDAKEIVLNLEHPYVAPTLDGKPINYKLPWTVKSPFMESEYKSGVFSAQFDNEKLELNSTRCPGASPGKRGAFGAARPDHRLSDCFYLGNTP